MDFMDLSQILSKIDDAENAFNEGLDAIGEVRSAIREERDKRIKMGEGFVSVDKLPQSLFENLDKIRDLSDTIAPSSMARIERLDTIWEIVREMLGQLKEVDV